MAARRQIGVLFPAFKTGEKHARHTNRPLNGDGRALGFQLDKDEYETLHHLTASLGLRYGF